MLTKSSNLESARLKEDKGEKDDATGCPRVSKGKTKVAILIDN
jgi:hypothetical protein